MSAPTETVQTLTNVNEACHSPRQFKTASVEQARLETDAYLEGVLAGREVAVLAHGAGDQDATARGREAVAQTRDELAGDVVARLAAATLNHMALDAYARDAARSHLDLNMLNGRADWPVRCLRGLEPFAGALAEEVKKGVWDWVFQGGRGNATCLWAQFSSPVDRLLKQGELGAALAATEELTAMVGAEVMAAQGMLQESLRASVVEARASLAETTRKVQGALSFAAPKAAPAEADPGLWERVKQFFLGLVMTAAVPEAGESDARDQMMGLAAAQTRTACEEFLQARVQMYGMEGYVTAMEAVRDELEALHARISAALAVIDECAGTAAGRMVGAESVIEGLSDSLLSDPDVTGELAALCGEEQFQPAAAYRQWLGALGVDADPLQLGDKDSGLAFRTLERLLAADARLHALAGMSVEGILARLPGSALQRIVTGLVAGARGRIVFEQGLDVPPVESVILGIPGWSRADSPLAARIRATGLLELGVEPLESPYGDTVIAASEAHFMGLLNLPGIVERAESYELLPERDEGGYDKPQAFTERGLQEFACNHALSEERIIHVYLVGLASGKILDCAKQRGRRPGAEYPIKLVPDAETETAFGNAYGARLKHMPTIGTSVEAALVELGRHPEWVAEIEEFVTAQARQHGASWLPQRLAELDRDRRFRQDPGARLVARLKELLGGEAQR